MFGLLIKSLLIALADSCRMQNGQGSLEPKRPTVKLEGDQLKSLPGLEIPAFILKTSYIDNFIQHFNCFNIINPYSPKRAVG